MEREPSQEPSPARTRQRWWGVGKLALGIGLLAFLLNTGAIDMGRLLVIRERWELFLLAQLFFMGQFALTLVRWRFLLAALAVPARWADVIRLGWIGLLFSQVIPGATGGDLVKGITVARESPGRRAEAAFSVVLDRVLGLVGLLVLGVMALLLHQPGTEQALLLDRLAWIFGAVLVGALAGGWALSREALWRLPILRRFLHRVPGGALVERLGRGLVQLRRQPHALLFGLLLSVLAHGLGAVMQLCLASALLEGQAPPAAQFLFLVSVGQLATALPLTPGGLGVGEWAYERLFSAAGSGGGSELMLLVRFSWVLWALPGVFFVIRGRRQTLQPKPSGADSSAAAQDGAAL